MDRLADFKGFLPPYSIAQVELSHVKEEFVHSRSTVESACEAQQKTVPSSAGDVYLWLYVCLNFRFFAFNYMLNVDILLNIIYYT